MKLNGLGSGGGVKGGAYNWLIRASRQMTVVVVDLLGMTSEGSGDVSVVV